MRLWKGVIMLFVIIAVILSSVSGVVGSENINENKIVGNEQKSLASTPWPMFHHDLQHTGRSPYDTSQNNGALKWKFKTGGDVYSSPTIGSDGTIYVGSHDHYLYAINPYGTLKWEFETGGWVESSPAIGSDGTIYVGSDDNYLYAIGSSGNGNIPSPPWNLDASAGDGYVTLSWDPPANDGGSAITEYRIYRGASPGSETLLATVSGTFYNDTLVVNGETYYYYVTAVNSAGESDPSNEVIVTPMSSSGGGGGNNEGLPWLWIIIGVIILAVIIGVILAIGRKKR